MEEKELSGDVGRDSESEDRSGISPKKPKVKIAVGVVATVLVVAGAGLWVWHEQPSFCSAVCHVPMDNYLATYQQEPGEMGIDKWGNTVDDTSGMLAVTHRSLNGDTCLSCHVPTLSEQIAEGSSWLTGNYEVIETKSGGLIPTERALGDLTAAKGGSPESFCLNEACHANDDGSVMSREDLIDATSEYARNPHMLTHGELSCDTCHSAHAQSVNYCSTCHDDAPIPDGWLSAEEAKERDSSR